MVWTSRPVKSLRGTVRAPGDKSCSHRALIFGGLAEGTSRFSGLLEGDDVLRTGQAMAALGADVKRLGGGDWEVTGVGARGLSSPQGILDFGNSGTGSRLMMGVMAGHDLTAELTGDKSLCSRPMNRILTPLRQMGLTDTAGPDGRLPFSLTGTKALKAITYAPPQASAQIKSAVLLAGLSANGTTVVEEAKPTRDHTERMLRGFGAEAAQHTLGMVAGGLCLFHHGGAVGREAGQQDGGLDLRRGLRRGIGDGLQRLRAGEGKGQAPVRAGRVGQAHLAQRGQDAVHRAGTETFVAGQFRRQVMPGHDAHHQARARAGIAEIQNSLRRGEASGADAGDFPVPAAEAFHVRAEGRHGLSCPQHIVAFQQAGETACPLRQATENQGPVAAGFVPRRADGSPEGFDGTAGPDHVDFRADFLRELGL